MYLHFDRMHIKSETYLKIDFFFFFFLRIRPDLLKTKWSIFLTSLLYSAPNSKKQNPGTPE